MFIWDWYYLLISTVQILFYLVLLCAVQAFLKSLPILWMLSHARTLHVPQIFIDKNRHIILWFEPAKQKHGHNLQHHCLLSYKVVEWKKYWSLYQFDPSSELSCSFVWVDCDWWFQWRWNSRTGEQIPRCTTHSTQRPYLIPINFYKKKWIETGIEACKAWIYCYNRCWLHGSW